MSGLENLEPLYIPKKRKMKELEALENKKDDLKDKIKSAAKRFKVQGGFDQNYWSSAVCYEKLCLEKTRVCSDISFSTFDGADNDWAHTKEAREFYAQIRAHQDRIRVFSAHGEALSPENPQRGLRASYLKLFTSSRTGLGITTGAGPRDNTMQSRFREKLLQDYGSLDVDKVNAWCPVLKVWISKEQVKAAHLFAYKHGQDTMDAIFGTVRPAELFSSRNGLILHHVAEECMDKGDIVIIPDMPDKPQHQRLFSWFGKEPQEYKVRVLTTNELDLKRIISGGTTLADLDNSRLQFRSKFRPAARYLYFHYCTSMLKMAWRAGEGSKAAAVLQPEFGKPVWATPGRYIAKNMLQAFVEELGHEYNEFFEQGADPFRRGPRRALLNTAVAEIAAGDEEEEEDEEDNDDDVASISSAN